MISSEELGVDEREYLVEGARRLAEVLGDPISMVDGFAVIQVLTLHVILFRDGFCLNDDGDTNRIIGVNSASAIVAAFAEPRRSPSWWKAEYHDSDLEGSEHAARCLEILSDIRRHPWVRIVSCGASRA